MSRNAVFGAVLVCLALSACGTRPEERGITGAGLGAAGGAIVGAVTGLTVLQGALIGTAVGGVTGLLTDREQLDIGEPFWRWLDRDSGRQVARGPAASYSPVVAQAQNGLAQLGYDPGPVDGLQGPRTASAIRQYEADHGLAVTGRANATLAERIEAQAVGEISR